MIKIEDLFGLATKVNEFTTEYAERSGTVDVRGNITVSIEASNSDIESIDSELYLITNGSMEGYKPAEKVDCTIYGVHYIVKPFVSDEFGKEKQKNHRV